MTRLYMYLLLGVLAASCSSEGFDIQEGDILFQDIDCGAYCESIETVTQGIDGAHLSHCGIAIKSEQGTINIIEAVSRGVVITPLDSFLNRASDASGNPKVLLGRLKNTNPAEIQSILSNAKSKLGKPYDKIYDLEDDAYYCSELVYFAFKRGEEFIFQPHPMTFTDPKTNKTFPEWVSYFNDLGIDIPEGKPGLNPGGISQSEYIEIVHVFGYPEGYTPN